MSRKSPKILCDRKTAKLATILKFLILREPGDYIVASEQGRSTSLHISHLSGTAVPGLVVEISPGALGSAKKISEIIQPAAWYAEIMTREKVLDMLAAKPIPGGLFRDWNNGRLYRTHYMGMGEWFAIDVAELAELVDDMLRKGEIVQTERLLGCPEMRLINRSGEVKTVPALCDRKGYAIEICPGQRA